METVLEWNMFCPRLIQSCSFACCCSFNCVRDYFETTLSSFLLFIPTFLKPHFDMAGRPPGKTYIVDPQEVLTLEEIKEKNYIFTDLPYSRGKMLVLEFLAKNKLIKNSNRCGTCNGDFHLNAYEQSGDGFRWYCKTWKKRKSIREGSFFKESRMSLHSIIVIMYCWARDIPQKNACEEAGGASPRTIVDWYNFCRDICAQWLENNPMEIGGLTENGDSIVVEIDESKFFHRKYHRGQWRQGHWVFGGIESQSRKCFLVEVPDRRRETLEEKIRQFILPGTHIISDGWPSYTNIEGIDGGVYSHQVIIHEQNFVDSDDNAIHTQNVENLWMRVKRKLRRQFGTSDLLFTSYLHEFMWRGRFKDIPIFSALIICINQFYNV